MKPLAVVDTDRRTERAPASLRITAVAALMIGRSLVYESPPASASVGGK